LQLNGTNKALQEKASEVQQKTYELRELDAAKTKVQTELDDLSTSGRVDAINGIDDARLQLHDTDDLVNNLLQKKTNSAAYERGLQIVSQAAEKARSVHRVLFLFALLRARCDKKPGCDPGLHGEIIKLILNSDAKYDLLLHPAVKDVMKSIWFTDGEKTRYLTSAAFSLGDASLRGGFGFDYHKEEAELARWDLPTSRQNPWYFAEVLLDEKLRAFSHIQVTEAGWNLLTIGQDPPYENYFTLSPQIALMSFFWLALPPNQRALPKKNDERLGLVQMNVRLLVSSEEAKLIRTIFPHDFPCNLPPERSLDTRRWLTDPFGTECYIHENDPWVVRNLGLMGALENLQEPQAGQTSEVWNKIIDHKWLTMEDLPRH
jgi:hypothetical protein